MLNQMTNHPATSDLTPHGNGSGLFREILTATAICLIPHLPSFISRILDYPSEMMANGYSLDVAVG